MVNISDEADGRAFEAITRYTIDDDVMTDFTGDSATAARLGSGGSMDHHTTNGDLLVFETLAASQN